MTVMDQLFAGEQARGEAVKQEALRQQRHVAEGVRLCMESSGGRALLRWLLAQCEVFSAEYAADAGFVLFQQGRRHVGMGLVRLLQDQHPENMAKLLWKEKEHE